MQRKINLLLVDDNDTDVKITLRALKKMRHEYEVTVLNDGEEAWDYLKRQGRFSDSLSPLPDIILLDINMPRMDGHSLVREIRADQNLANTAIIVFSTKDGMQDLFKVEGVTDYVVKSLEADQLIMKIEQLFAQVDANS